MYTLEWNFTVWFSLSPYSLASWLCVCPCFQPIYCVTMRQVGWFCCSNRRLQLGVGICFQVWEWPVLGFCLEFWGCYCSFLLLKVLCTVFQLVCRSCLLWSFINAVLLVFEVNDSVTELKHAGPSFDVYWQLDVV